MDGQEAPADTAAEQGKHPRPSAAPAAVASADSPPAPVVGMVGAGQLARMTAAASVGLGIGFRVLAAAAGESAAQVSGDVMLGDHRSSADLLAFAAGCDVVTFDHEHVPQARCRRWSRPATSSGRVRRRCGSRRTSSPCAAGSSELGVPCPRFEPVDDLADVEAFADKSGWPIVLKAVTGGYDGRGVWVCDGLRRGGRGSWHTG